MNPNQLLLYVVRPTLEKMDMPSVAAERLIMGTIYQESRGIYLKQLGDGPALGLIQMEPATHDDIWLNYLTYKTTLGCLVTNLAGLNFSDEKHVDASELITNLAYAVAMCRVHYLRVKAPLPEPDDIEALGLYWKMHYNTYQGKGTVEEFMENFPREILQ